jgi:tRNA threonylcarbamoyladenosine biosynthesis protein TsaE
MKILSRSALETKKIGEKLGRRLKAGDVVTLSGELGAGKTTLVQGIAKGLGVKQSKDVSSPTFMLIHEYQGREKIYHMDWYRLKTVAGEDRFLAEECFSDQAITLVEWPDRGNECIPKKHVAVTMTHLSKSHRRVEVEARG